MTAYAPARPGPRPRIVVDPRLRARRVTVLREQGRRRLRRLLIVLGVIALAGSAVGVALSPLLAVDHVTLQGVPADREASVRAAAQIGAGDPILLVDTGAATARIERLPWVAHARVERQLPDGIRIAVTTRAPVGWLRAPDGSFRLVARGGGLLGPVLFPPPGLPELAGGVRPGGLAVPAAAEVAAALPASMRVQTATITVSGGLATLHLVDGTEVRLGEPTGIAGKARAALAVLGALGRPVAYVDVQVPSIPVTG